MVQGCLTGTGVILYPSASEVILKYMGKIERNKNHNQAQ